MKTKRTFMKNGLLYFTLIAVLIGNLSFTNLEKKSEEDPEYFYLVAWNRNSNKKIYVSRIITYNGYSACKEYITKGKFLYAATYKFMDYLEDVHGINRSEWKVYYGGKNGINDYPEGYFPGYDSRVNAQDGIDNHIQEKKNSGYHDSVHESTFSYSCE